MAAGHRSHCAHRAVQARLGQPDAGERARAIELGLQQRELRVEHVGAGRDAGVEAVARRRAAPRRRSAPRRRRPRRRRGWSRRRAAAAARRRWICDVELRQPLARARSARAGRLGDVRPACGPQSHNGQLTLTPTSHESCHVSCAREDARVRVGVVEARRPATTAGSRASFGGPRRSSVPSMRCASACRSGRCAERFGDERLLSPAVVAAAPRGSRPATIAASSARPISRRRSVALDSRWLRASISSSSSRDALRLAARARRSAASGRRRSGAHVARCASARPSASSSTRTVSVRGDERPVGAGDFEPQVGRAALEVLPVRRASARAARSSASVRPPV